MNKKATELYELNEKIISKVEKIKGIDVWTSFADDPKGKEAMFAFTYKDYHYIVDIKEKGKVDPSKTKKQILALPKDSAIRIFALRYDQRFSKEREEIKNKLKSLDKEEKVWYNMSHENKHSRKRRRRKVGSSKRRNLRKAKKKREQGRG